jgi:hypothetical protein
MACPEVDRFSAKGHGPKVQSTVLRRRRALLALGGAKRSWHSVERAEAKRVQVARGLMSNSHVLRDLQEVSSIKSVHPQILPGTRQRKASRLVSSFEIEVLRVAL